MILAQQIEKSLVALSPPLRELTPPPTMYSRRVAAPLSALRAYAAGLRSTRASTAVHLPSA